MLEDACWRGDAVNRQQRSSQRTALSVGDKITANKAKPSKPNPFGKGGRLICKAEAAP